MNPTIIAPSILSADFAILEKQVRESVDAGGRYIHIDVMDGHFVPNISIGPIVVRALRPLADELGIVLDVHLMIERPDEYIAAFAKAGADILTVHVEACEDVAKMVVDIRKLGGKPGITLKPDTPLSAIQPVLPDIDLALVMSVEPGFGGQAFIPGSIEKIKQLRGMLDEVGSSADLEVDGGVKIENAAEIVAAGANVLVAGSAIFGGNRTIKENVQGFLDAIGQK